MQMKIILYVNFKAQYLYRYIFRFDFVEFAFFFFSFNTTFKLAADLFIIVKVKNSKQLLISVYLNLSKSISG